MNWKTILFCSLAAIFTIDGVLRAIRSNYNFGLFLVYCITVALWIYGIFNKPIDAFTSHGIGFILKVLFLCGCAFLTFMLCFITISGKWHRPIGNEKAVIVLGAGLRGDVVSGVLKRRLDAAYEFYTENPEIYVVVSGGRGPDELIPEAVAMKKYLVGRGIPEDIIIEEGASTSTEENFKFSLKLLQERGIDKAQPIAFSTNNFHCYRSKKYAEKAGFENVKAISAPTGISSIMPCYLREVFAVLYYWVFRH